jgi:hypothetical protein
MAIFGRYNWWLPGRVGRAFRVEPSQLLVPRRPQLRRICATLPRLHQLTSITAG